MCGEHKGRVERYEELWGRSLGVGSSKDAFLSETLGKVSRGGVVVEVACARDRAARKMLEENHWKHGLSPWWAAK